MNMNKLARPFSLALLCCTAALSEADTIDPADPNLQYTGRWNFDNPSAPKVTWHGSTVKFRFNGTSASVDIDAGSRSPYGNQWKEQYRVIVDGVASPDRIFMDPGRATYTLADNLPTGDHTLTLFKETTYSYKSASTIYGIDIVGTLLAPPARPSLRIDFFGDSDMDGTSNYSEKDSGDSGGYYAFPAMVSRMLDAEMNIQAMGGATLDNAGQGGDNDVQSFIYSEDYINQDTSYRSGFDPHVIVIKAGANDVGAGKAEIKTRYNNVINSLREVYGNTPHIVLMNSYGWDANEPANYSHEVVAEVGGNLSILLTPWLVEQWHGPQWQHSGQAHMLAEHIASLNPTWSIKNTNDIVDGYSHNDNFVNGSFEHAAPFGGYGWPYYTDGVERVNDSANAADGSYFIRLEQGEQVHQPTDATGDLVRGGTSGGETYTITAKMRGTSGGAVATIETHFQERNTYSHDDDPSTFQSSSFNLTGNWQEYTHAANAASGIWTLFNYIQATSGTIEVDDVRMSMGGQQPSPPVAGFSVATNNLNADFTDLSSDDGVINQWNWSFGDSNNSTSQNPSHSYTTAGTYNVSLTVTDDEGITDSTNQNVTVSEGSAGVTMAIGSATLNRKGRLTVNLTWSGAAGNNVDIIRNGNVIATTANDGAYKNVSTNIPSGTYTYQVCETNGGSCSSEESVNL